MHAVKWHLPQLKRSKALINLDEIRGYLSDDVSSCRSPVGPPREGLNL